MAVRTQKQIYFDLETTGLDHYYCAIHQMACLFVINGEVRSSLDIKMAPFPGARIDEEALEKGGVTIGQIMEYPDWLIGFNKFIETLKSFHKPNETNKFLLCGYNNAPFDNQFLRQYSYKAHLKWSSYYYSPPIDVMTLVGKAILKGLRLQNYRLKTVCEYYGIPLTDAHEGMADVTATKALDDKLDSILYQGNNK